MDVLLEVEISTTNVTLLNEADVGSTVDFFAKIADFATQVLRSFA